MKLKSVHIRDPHVVALVLAAMKQRKCRKAAGVAGDLIKERAFELKLEPHYRGVA